MSQSLKNKIKNNNEWMIMFMGIFAGGSFRRFTLGSTAKSFACNLDMIEKAYENYISLSGVGIENWSEKWEAQGTEKYNVK